MDDGECGSTHLEAVRSLHQTVVALRAALEESRNEIEELKRASWSVAGLEDALKTLSIENHLLRRRCEGGAYSTSAATTETKISAAAGKVETCRRPEAEKQVRIVCSGVAGKVDSGYEKQETIACVSNDSVAADKTDTCKPPGTEKQVRIACASVDATEKKVSVAAGKEDPRHEKQETTACVSKHSVAADKADTCKPPQTNRQIRNTFKTTDSPVGKVETCKRRKQVPGSNFEAEISIKLKSGIIMDPSPSQNDLDDQEVDDIELIFTTDDTKDDDFKEELVSIETGEEGRLAPGVVEGGRSPELEDEVFGEEVEATAAAATTGKMCTSRSDTSVNFEENRSLRSCCSYQDSSFENKSMEKDESFDRFEERLRIVETDISKIGIVDLEYTCGRRNTCPNPLQYRPIHHREALSKGLNVRKTRPILAQSNATRRESGAQTDISAIPTSSWRSESSLANKIKGGENFPTLPSKFPLPNSRLRLSEKTVEARRVLLSDIGFTSMVPELSRSADHLCPGNTRPTPVATTYGQFLKTTDLYSPCFTSQKFVWTTSVATPSEGSHSHSRYSSFYPLSPPVAARRCSAPVSPSRRPPLKSTPSKVRFANGSLPELRSDWTSTVDSGDSTDSLVEEAESYLRRSIDCLTGRESHTNESTRRWVPRRASAPEPSRDNVPPQGWQPFLPRIPRDLRLDHWVKVISPEGRVRGGRVRYVGPVVGQQEQHVGVQLCTPDGDTDGTFGGRRYFQCEPYHGLFVAFKKIVMGWRP